MLVLKRIQVRYTLKVDPEKREAAERAHALHQENCPVACSLQGAIAITTSLELEP